MATWGKSSVAGRLPALFALAGVIVLGGLTWMGWRLIGQDRALENQNIRDRLESASSLICRELDRSLAEWENAQRAPAGGVLVTFSSTGIVRQQGVPLPFQPFVAPPAEPPAGLFAATEKREFQEQRYDQACPLYRDLARTGNRLVRAGALMRLGRCLRKQHRLHDTLPVYEELAGLGETPVAGSPAGLLARRERISAFRDLSDRQAAERESALLAAALQEGRFPIDRATFEFYREGLPAQAFSADLSKRLAMAEAVEMAWARWRQAPEQSSDRLAFSANDTVLAGVLRKTPTGAAAVIAPLDGLMTRLDPSLRQLRVRMQIADPQGRWTWGDAPSGNEIHVAKAATDTGLPWSVRVASADPAAERAVAASRRKLVISILVLIALALAAATYAIFRATVRELSVARLQSDFVAAVSHEFRSPLAAMCHLTELLEENRVPEDRRPAYYQALAKENRRLRELVEGLLDFARMESGRQVYRQDELEVADLVRGVVQEFGELAASGGRRIELDLTDTPHYIQGDGEAISRAVRNLLDNAAKYSPPSSPIRVSVAEQEGRVIIAVQDEGPGIPKAEQQAIFAKFVRGSASRELDVKGTGIGLAMVRHIVEAHGGSVTVESEPGHGSRFTIRLPFEKSRLGEAQTANAEARRA